MIDKPDGSKRFVLNLKNLNKFILTEHFKLEDVKVACKLVFQGFYMAHLDLKDAYFLIPVHEESRKYLRFYFQNELYEFLVIPFGLCTAPFIFTKLLKPVANYLRNQGFSSVVYLDDFLCIAKNFELCHQNMCATKTLLKKLGFIINEVKSKMTPSTICQFLGVIINSNNMTLELPQNKRLDIFNIINKLENVSSCKIRIFAQFIGKLIAACPTIKYSWLYTKRFERQKFLALMVNDNDYDAKINLTEELEDDLLWWKSNILSGINSFKPPNYKKIIFTDASRTGWGAFSHGEKVHGFWSVEERKCHINFLELLSIFFALEIFTKDISDCDILLRVDNTTAISYVNRMGGIKFPPLNSVSKRIWQLCERKNIWIFASYIQSEENVEADKESRLSNIDTEWELADFEFSRIINQFGMPNIDLFATRINKKCNVFCSWHKDPESTFIDAFTLNWNMFYFYAFPPFSLILRSLQKIVCDKATGILVVPFWTTQPWFPLFESLLVEKPLHLTPSKNLLMSPCRELQHPLQNNLALIAGKLSGTRFLKNP